MSTFDGYNGQLEIGEDELVLRRAGMVARTTFGKADDRRIPLAALGDVRMRKPTFAVNGWIQLVLGAAAASGPGKGAPSDPDVVLFTYGKRARLTECYEALRAIVEANRADGLDPTAATFETGSSRMTRMQDMQGRLAGFAAADPGHGPLLDTFSGVRLYARWIDGGTDGAGPVAGAQATIDSAGSIDRRLSLTRVAATGGLGLFWKKKVDKRELYLLIEGNGFAFVREVNPDQGLKARAFAAKVTATAAASAAPPQPAPAEMSAPSAAPDPAEQIRRFAQLRDEGLLSEDEFAAKKAQILGLG